jgi:hypothetical protein
MRLGSIDLKRKCRIHMKKGDTPKFNIDDKRGKFSMLPRSSKWIMWNMTLGTGDSKLYEKYYGDNIGKVGPCFEKLDKREYILYTADLSWNAGYINLDHYDNLYKKLGHVEKPSGINMSKMLCRKQFADTSSRRPLTNNNLNIKQLMNKRAKQLAAIENKDSLYLKICNSKVRKNFSSLLMEHGYIRGPTDVDFGGGVNSKK